MFKVETTEELIEQSCIDLAAKLKELHKFDRNAAWDRIHKVGWLIEDTDIHIEMYRRIEES